MTVLPFEYTNELVNLIAEITEKIGRLEENGAIARDLHLRKKNRVKTVQSTTAIEQNTLTLAQVSDVIDGKVVIGPKDEILEVQNTYRAYENIEGYKPFEVKSFLEAHSYITAGLIETSGRFRHTNAGVFEGEKVIHMGARPEYILGLVNDLFKWGEKSEVHPLVISSIMHLEIETIHPFEDGNGRIGRLWQTLILSKWKSIFEYIPIETLVYRHQQKYYDALEESRDKDSSHPFVEFMLRVIDKTLDELEEVDLKAIFVDISVDIIVDNLSEIEISTLKHVVRFLKRNEFITNQQLQNLTGKAQVSVRNYLRKFVEYGILIAVGQNKGRKYKLNEDALRRR